MGAARWYATPNNNNKSTKGFNSKFIFLYNYAESITVNDGDKFISSIISNYGDKFQFMGNPSFYLESYLNPTTYRFKLYFDTTLSYADGYLNFILNNNVMAPIYFRCENEGKGMFVAEFLLSINYDAGTGEYFFTVVGRCDGASEEFGNVLGMRIRESIKNLITPDQNVDFDFVNLTGQNIYFYGLTVEEIQ